MTGREGLCDGPVEKVNFGLVHHTRTNRRTLYLHSVLQLLLSILIVNNSQYGDVKLRGFWGTQLFSIIHNNRDRKGILRLSVPRLLCTEF